MTGTADSSDRLRQAGLEPTSHRLRVLDAVSHADYPTTAAEILERVRQDSDINRVTVYRILDLLVEYQVLNRLGLGEKSQRFCLRDANHDHPHFHCTCCDRYLCLHMDSLPVDAEALTRLGLTVDHVDVRFEGICPACRKRK